MLIVIIGVVVVGGLAAASALFMLRGGSAEGGYDRAGVSKRREGQAPPVTAHPQVPSRGVKFGFGDQKPSPAPKSRAHLGGGGAFKKW